MWSGPMTHRQFMVWQRWMKDEWVKPSRTDRYIMRLIWVVDNMFRKETIPEEDYRLRFKNPPMKRQLQQSDMSKQVRTIPVDPTGETVVGLPNPPTSSQEEQTAKAFMGSADPSTIVDATSDDESWKRQRKVWLKYAGIPTDADGNVIKKK